MIFKIRAPLTGTLALGLVVMVWPLTLQGEEPGYHPQAFPYAGDAVTGQCVTVAAAEGQIACGAVHQLMVSYGTSLHPITKERVPDGPYWCAFGGKDEVYASGFFYLFRVRGGSVERAPTQELVGNGCVLSDGCLFSAVRSVYFWGNTAAAPELVAVLDNDTGKRLELIHSGTATWVVVQRKRVLKWTGRRLVPDDTHPWLMQGLAHRVATAAGDVIAFDHKVVDCTGRSLMAQPFRDDLFSGSDVDFTIDTHGSLVKSNYARGISSYSLGSGLLEWDYTDADSLPNPAAIQVLKHQFLVSYSQGLAVLPDPKSWTYSRHRGYTNLETIDLPTGPACCTGEGLVDVATGTYLTNSLVGSALATPKGLLVSKPDGLVWPDGHRYVGARWPDGLVQDDSGNVAFVSGDGRVWRTTLTGADPIQVSTPAKPAMLAAGGRGEILLLTASGVYRGTLNPAKWRELAAGSFILEHSLQGSLIVSPSAVFDSDARLLGSVPAGFQIIGATRYRGRPLVVVRHPKFGVGAAFLAPWEPICVPHLPADSLDVASFRDQVYFIGGRLNVRAAAFPRLEAPLLRVRLDEHPDGRLASDESDLAFEVVDLPDPDEGRRAYEYRLGAQPWHVIPTEGVVHLERLPYGASRLEVSVAVMGLATSRSIEINRAFPWWMRWWALAGYVGLLLSGVGALIRWGMARGARRARELEQIVAMRTDELRKAHDERELFISGMSHELRNPLNGLTGVATMLRESESDPRKLHLLEVLAGCTDQMRGIVDDVTDFRRIDAGETRIDLKPVALTALLESTCQGSDLGGARIRTRLRLPNDPWAQADSGKLRMVLGNLIENALKYGDPPGAEVGAELGEHGQGKIQLTLSVVSRGLTIPPEELARLFEPFYRGSRARETGAAGSGLGLALCRRLVQAHGGEIRAFSERGETKFVVTLVLEGAQSEPESLPPPGSHGVRVLGIEDESYNRLVLGHLLKSCGCEVFWAASFSAAVTAVQRHSFDVVFMDWMMPEGTGDKLLPRLRSAAKALPPVVVVSAYSTVKMHARFLQAGATTFVPKPVTKQTLWAALRKIGVISDQVGAPHPGGPEAESVDFSTLRAADPSPLALSRFFDEAETRLKTIATLIPQSRERAAAAAHEFKAQLTTIRAEALASLAGLLEQQIRDGVPPNEIEVTVSAVGAGLADLRANAE